MKKYLLFILLLFTANINCLAEEIEMYEDSEYNEDDGHPHKSPPIKPHVFYENQILTISSQITLSNATIIIRDAEGNVIYSLFIIGLSGYYSCNLPYSEQEMYSIELIYSGYHLLGYF